MANSKLRCDQQPAVLTMEKLTQVLKRFKNISVCQIVDALGPSHEFENEIKPINPHFRICGPTVTVFCPHDDNLTLHHALQLAKPGEILVVSGDRNYGAALWGELMSASARARGLAGTIIDGAARDLLELQAIGYPVFARAIMPRRATKEKYGSIGVPIRCGKLQVNSHDIIFADANGIIAIPPGHLEQTLNLALEGAKKESEIKKQIKAGRSILEILDLKGKVPGRKRN
jgi:4-hydroxy-4-methyl-2-oxoglutarate aldolase